ncbi:hypothetical protein AtubIFM55763_010086, partial [Aspergillus tubingensis]
GRNPVPAAGGDGAAGAGTGGAGATGAGASGLCLWAPFVSRAFLCKYTLIMMTPPLHRTSDNVYPSAGAFLPQNTTKGTRNVLGEARKPVAGPSGGAGAAAAASGNAGAANTAATPTTTGGAGGTVSGP